jgi:signal transduction histidine kinase
MRLFSNRYRKIPLLFLLGIGIPCVLLGYLAFRGIKNDQALIEKEKLGQHREVLEGITGSVEENILNTELSAFDMIKKYQDSIPDDLYYAVDSLKESNPLLDEVFLFDQSERIRFPFARLLFLPDGGTQSATVLSEPGESSQILRRGQQLEFQDKNYQDALLTYGRGLEQASDPGVKAELLNAIGRVQKKLTLFQDAVTTYEIISHDYDQILSAVGVPLGLAARSEIGSLYLAISDTLAGLEAFIKLYEDIISGAWILEKAQYDFYSQRIKESIGNVFSGIKLDTTLRSYQNAFAALNDKERKQTGITERLLNFQKNANLDLGARGVLNSEETRNPNLRFTLESGGYVYLISLPGQFANDEHQINDVPGLLLNAEYLKDSLLYWALSDRIATKKTTWFVKGIHDETLLKSEIAPSGSATIRANFEAGFPPWFIEIYEQGTDLFEAFLTSRRGIYFYMFVLLAGILIFGLSLTIRTVLREMELSRMKSDFVSTISHEFKSPLSSIRQLSEMLQSGRIPAEEYRQQYYDVLVEQSERLSLLVENILDFAKIEEGKKEFDFEVAEISSLLQEIVSVIQDQVRHKKFKIQLEIEDSLPLIKMDRRAISQAITNLIDNAIKYSGEARTIIVRVFTEDPYLVITIKDFGIGIRKEELNKVFERFYRGGDELTRKVKGSGLGLTLVKQIIKVHSGTVGVESEPGKGSTFSIRLPLLHKEERYGKNLNH